MIAKYKFLIDMEMIFEPISGRDWKPLIPDPIMDFLFEGPRPIAYTWEKTDEYYQKYLVFLHHEDALMFLEKFPETK